MNDQSMKPVRKGEFVSAALQCFGMFDLRIFGNADLAERLRCAECVSPPTHEVLCGETFPTVEALSTVSLVQTSAGNFSLEERTQLIEPSFVERWSRRHLYPRYALRHLVVASPPRLALARADYDCNKPVAWFLTPVVSDDSPKRRFVSVAHQRKEVCRRVLDLRDWDPGSNDVIIFAVVRRGERDHFGP